MASQTITGPEPNITAARKPERELLQRLLGLYAEERQIYGTVLDLSRRQGELVRQGGGLHDVRRVLEKKKNCLEIIGRLELMEKRNKQDWERRRREFSQSSRRQLRESLKQVTSLIEEILACEEQNDRALIEQARTI